MMRRRSSLAVGAMVLVLAGCGSDDDDGPRPTPTRTAAATAALTVPPATATASAPTATATEAPTSPPATATADASGTPVATATAIDTATPIGPTPTVTTTPTITPTPTVTATPVPPELLLFGVARADDLLQEPNGFDDAGRPIYVRAQGQGMSLIVEARRGTFRLQPVAYDPDGLPPGVEIVASRPLGDGSPAVCDIGPPRIGGVPGVEPPFFGGAPAERDAIADLGCRINDGTGQPLARTATAACTRDAGAIYAFSNARTELQYCLPIARAWGFPPGDTIVAARVRDLGGHLSVVHEIVIRVETQPFECGGGLGERVFTPSRPASALLVNLQAGDVSLENWIADPLRLCAGPEFGDGMHILTLREDARFAVPTLDGSVLCGTMHARGTIGVLDCDGGSPQDVRAVWSADDPRIVVDNGVGLPAGTGAASLRSTVTLRVLPPGAAPIDCYTTSGGTTVSAGLTTATATAEVRNADGGVEAALSASGAPFDCATWVDGGSPALVLPIPAAGTPAGTVAAALVLGD